MRRNKKNRKLCLHLFIHAYRNCKGNSLAVQWLGLHAFTAKNLGSVPGQETKIPYAAWCSQKEKRNRKKSKTEDNYGYMGTEGLRETFAQSTILTF